MSWLSWLGRIGGGALVGKTNPVLLIGSEILGDTAGIIDALNRRYGFLPDYLGDVVDSLDDLGILNSLAEASGFAPSTSYGSQVRDPAKMASAIGMMFSPGGGLAKGIRIVGPIIGEAGGGGVGGGNPPVPPSGGARQQEPVSPTVQGKMAEAIIEQALADAAISQEYARWLRTQPQMADLYVKWHEAYPRMYDESVDEYAGRLWGE